MDKELLQVFTGAQRSFHCQEVSKLISLSQRAEGEAMKREAQRQRQCSCWLHTSSYNVASRATADHTKGQSGDPRNSVCKARSHSQHPDAISSPNIIGNEDPLKAPTGVPYSFQCRDVYKSISLTQRTEKDAMKREAQQQREEAARITRMAWTAVCYLTADIWALRGFSSQHWLHLRRI